jgi:hypothetical protein
MRTVAGRSSAATVRSLSTEQGGTSMSAPVTDRTATRPARTATVPARRGGRPGGVTVPAQRGRQGGAALRAYARRDERVRRLAVGRPAAPAGRAQFVLLVMVLLAVGLVATLWLSTAAAADSYRLQDARLEARTLGEQSARLHREVTAMQAAPALAERARAMGMVPVQDAARLVVLPDGGVQVVGRPQVVPAPAPPVPAATPEDGTTPDGDTPAGGAGPDDGTPAEAAPSDGEPAATAGAGEEPAEPAAGAEPDPAAQAAADGTPAGTD